MVVFVVVEPPGDVQLSDRGWLGELGIVVALGAFYLGFLKNRAPVPSARSRGWC